jgi:hypothetical protein
MNTTVGWFPIVTFLLGFLSKFVTDWIQHHHERKRDRESRKEARRDQLSDQRRSFQRETLLVLQDATMDLMRTSVASAHNQDEMNHRTTGQWTKKHLLGDDLDENRGLAMRRTAMLGVRVRDSSLRTLTTMLREHATNADTGRDRDAIFAEISKMATVFQQIQERVGELLRTLDDEELDQTSAKP